MILLGRDVTHAHMDMRKRTRTLGAVASTGFVAVALVGLFLAVRTGGEASAARPTENTAAASVPRAVSAGTSTITVSFKLDSRLTQSLYMGDRWVSPPTYQHAAQVGESATLEAMVQLADGRGRALAARPTWKAVDPEMVTVTPSQGDHVKITVRRPGQTHLRLAQGDVSKELTLKAVRQNGVWRVDVAQ